MTDQSSARRMMEPAHRVVSNLSSNPRVWNLFRRVLELNFHKERSIIRRELFRQARCIRQQGRRPRVLDLGCGTGELASIFLQAGYRYVGIDIEPVRVAYAKAQHPRGLFQVMDASELGYADSCFDQILVTGVLHHLPDATVGRIVEEMRRTLKPGGRALVMEDIEVNGSLNLLGRLVHLADAGEHIRRCAEYAPLLQVEFAIRTTYPIRSGVCDYQVFVLE